MLQVPCSYYFSILNLPGFLLSRGHAGWTTPTMLSERKRGGEVGPLRATVAPPASTAGQTAEVMRPPSDITWEQVGRDANIFFGPIYIEE